MDNYIALASGQGPRGGRPRGLQRRRHAVRLATRPSPPPARSVRDTPNWNYGQVVSSARSQRSPRCHAVDHQRLHLPDRDPHPLRPVQRSRRELEGLRPGSRGRPAHRLHLLRRATACPAVTTAPVAPRARATNNPVVQPHLPDSGVRRVPLRRDQLHRRPRWWPARALTNNPQYSDQYVAKHFPFPWFASLTGGGARSIPMGTAAHRAPGHAGGGPTATPTTSPTWTTPTTA